MNHKAIKNDERGLSQIRKHYDIEKELASQLRHASKAERRTLYSSLYDELYRRVPDHQQLTRRSSPAETARSINSQIKFVKRFLTHDMTFLEIGPGDCSLSLEIAKVTKRVFAVDVSGEIATVRASSPKNFQLILSDGCSIPVPQNSVNVAYSNQLMEHLHPEDAAEQLENIYEALSVGGTYVCVTPNRLTGPHDISQHFDSVATGFHLKEYTISELRALLKECGFRRIRSYVGGRGIYIRVPVDLLTLCEKVFCMLPATVRRPLARTILLRVLLNIRLSATK